MIFGKLHKECFKTKCTMIQSLVISRITKITGVKAMIAIVEKSKVDN